MAGVVSRKIPADDTQRRDPKALGMTLAAIREALAAGRRFHQAGDLPRAKQAYQQVLEADPDQAEAWYLLGSVCQALGEPGEAATNYQRALRLKPGLAAAHNCLGIILAQQGDQAGALACFRQAVQLSPDSAEAHSNLGCTLKEQGKRDEALICFRHAVRLNPDFAVAQINLGNLLRELGHFAEAVACCRRAVQLEPDLAEAHYNLGLALADQGERDEAATCLRGALRLKPDHAGAYMTLGKVFLEQGQLDDAWASYQHAARLAPNDPAGLYSLGIVLFEQGRYDEALASYQRALQLKPDCPLTHGNRSLAWLLLGRFEEGWPEYEWRWPGLLLSSRPVFSQPQWDGSPLDGRTILLYTEQGLGDTLHFIRYAPLVKQRGGTVVLACLKALHPLLANGPGIDRLIAPFEALPPFDVHAPLLSLPRIFGTTLATIPANVPYLFADPHLVEQWRRELDTFPGFKIGIAWQGSPKNPGDRKRSIPLAQFEPLAHVPGIQLFSLQKGLGREQLRPLADRWGMIDLTDRLDETTGAFMDTAAVMKSLDLVITADTAVAHLAGALGVPVWVALPFVPDWRWLLERSDSPWYPTARLFRQTRRGDWEGVFQRIAEALRQRLAAPAAPRPITVEIAPGELLDKISILEIKNARITDPAKLHNVRVELTSLVDARDRALPSLPDLEPMIAELKAVNEALWEIEDEIRICEKRGDFGPRFIALARSVYRQNDRRVALKRTINERLGSRIIEEKVFASD
jgi:tetratricopeptide (TPR) repeat protein